MEKQEVIITKRKKNTFTIDADNFDKNQKHFL